MEKAEFQTLLRDRLRSLADNQDGFDDDPELQPTLDLGADVATFLHVTYDRAWRVLDPYLKTSEAVFTYLTTIAKFSYELEDKREFVKNTQTQLMLIGYEEEPARLQAIKYMMAIENDHGSVKGFRVEAQNLITGEVLRPDRSRLN